ncbi:class I SAM-dependent methyltransferase [Pseudanabaena sp. FACHB-2040]|uniref:class I SAM-dependent methyltransferase n=1 Tax=Pseudanabaena sp. FACHB-2040 TaxID=2692859 RepID=UPI001688B42C|nr:class I SAM-dependent methyltransferase [Pseudanabaena sp. FACHB-2040]MBD2261400.1 class I SAM-dependent methyltransferase [Pseudanabaena sp. FACHB-2040]
MMLTEYLEQFDRIEGWLHKPTAIMTFRLCEFQRHMRFAGNLVEIGTYHGRYFFAFSGAAEKGEICIAVDLFEDQARNEDLPGYDEVGSTGIHSLTQDIFRDHARNLLPEHNVLIVQASSLDISPRHLMPNGLQARFFSIDGGHSATVFKHDLLLAEQVIAEHGIIAIDDILNPQWPGIITEVIRYLDRGEPQLKPIAFLPNKLLLGKGNFVELYKSFLRVKFPEALERKDAELSTFLVDQYRG